ncbi:hypothetical protein [Roseateles sp.]|uniref:hypothetical protein n=1 Tax=Roseateles sp. TaxID=1971397 RepID=UPI003263492E
MKSTGPGKRSTEEQGKTWSLCWQAVGDRNFLSSPVLAALIRSRLIGAHQRSGRVLIDFVVLPTEIHVIAKIGSDDTVSGIARAFGNVVSRWVRQAQLARGPVFVAAFSAQPINAVEDRKREMRMLAWRPVIKGVCATPTHHSTGALRVALGLTTAKGFDARPMLKHFGDAVPAARNALRQWISIRPSAEDWRAWELTRGLELARGNLGPHKFMAKVADGGAAKLIAAAGGYGMEAALELLGAWVGARVQPATTLDLHKRSDAVAARARALVACVAVEHRLCSAASVARYFGRAKATLSEQMTVCRSRPVDRLIVGTPLRRILEEAAALRSVQDGNRRGATARPAKR